MGSRCKHNKISLVLTVTFAFDSKAARASLVGPRGVNPQVINPMIPMSMTTPIIMRANFTLFSILPLEVLFIEITITMITRVLSADTWLT